MKVLYVSGPAFLDLDLSFVSHLAQQAEVHFLMDLYPRLHQATALDVKSAPNRAGIFDLHTFSGFEDLGEMLPRGQSYVLNRLSNNPLSISNLALQFKLWKWVRELNPDVIHFNNYIYFNHFYLFLTRNPKLISIHDPFPHSGAEKNFARLSARFTRYINNKRVKDHLLYNSSQASTYREAFGLHDTRIHLSRLGVYEYLQRYTEGGSDNEPIDLLFFGRMAPYKGLDVLMDAFRLIQQLRPGTTLTVAGAGESDLTQDQLDFPAEQFRFLNRFISNGELAGMIHRSKIVVCPYKDATQSGVIMTSYSLACPVVCSDVGGLAEMVEHGVTGLVVPPNDPNALAKSLVQLLSNDLKLTGMRSSIRDFYFTGSKSWDAIVTELMNVYRNVEETKL